MKGLTFIPQTAALACAMDREHGVIDHLNELSGWEIVGLTRWKSGVVRYEARRRMELKIGFAKDAIFAAVQLPP